MSVGVEHTVKVGQSTTVGDLRRGLARCPRTAKVTVSFGDIKATWRVAAEPPAPEGGDA